MTRRISEASDRANHGKGGDKRRVCEFCAGIRCAPEMCLGTISSHWQQKADHPFGSLSSQVSAVHHGKAGVDDSIVP